MSKKYRKKPIIIEALKWTGDNKKEVENFLTTSYSCDSDSLYINTLEGVMECSKGDYIIKGVAGEFYPCKPDIFEQTYEEVLNNE